MESRPEEEILEQLKNRIAKAEVGKHSMEYEIQFLTQIYTELLENFKNKVK